MEKTVRRKLTQYSIGLSDIDELVDILVESQEGFSQAKADTKLQLRFVFDDGREYLASDSEEFKREFRKHARNRLSSIAIRSSSIHRIDQDFEFSYRRSSREVEVSATSTKHEQVDSFIARIETLFGSREKTYNGKAALILYSSMLAISWLSLFKFFGSYPVKNLLSLPAVVFSAAVYLASDQFLTVKYPALLIKDDSGKSLNGRSLREDWYKIIVANLATMVFGVIATKLLGL